MSRGVSQLSDGLGGDAGHSPETRKHSNTLNIYLKVIVHVIQIEKPYSPSPALNIQESNLYWGSPISDSGLLGCYLNHCAKCQEGAKVPMDCKSS